MGGTSGLGVLIAFVAAVLLAGLFAVIVRIALRKSPQRYFKAPVIWSYGAALSLLAMLATRSDGLTLLLGLNVLLITAAIGSIVSFATTIYMWRRREQYRLFVWLLWGGSLAVSAYVAATNPPGASLLWQAAILTMALVGAVAAIVGVAQLARSVSHRA